MASTAPITNTAEEDKTITLKTSDLHQMLHDTIKEFMRKERGGIAPQPVAPQGDAQGWSDDDASDGEHHTGGVQFAESLQTTPGK